MEPAFRCNGLGGSGPGFEEKRDREDSRKSASRFRTGGGYEIGRNIQPEKKKHYRDLRDMAARSRQGGNEKERKNRGGGLVAQNSIDASSNKKSEREYRWGKKVLAFSKKGGPLGEGSKEPRR